jgi:hypothetical protein
MSLTIGRREARVLARPPVARAIFLFALAAGLATGFLIEHSGAAASADPDLTRLLRAMALLKLLFAAAAAATTLWRLQAPIAPGLLSLYALAAFAMAAGPGLIWTMTHVVLGAALLHAGLIASLVLLWRDPEVARLLAAAIARRRASLGERR